MCMTIVSTRKLPKGEIRIGYKVFILDTITNELYFRYAFNRVQKGRWLTATNRLKVRSRGPLDRTISLIHPESKRKFPNGLGASETNPSTYKGFHFFNSKEDARDWGLLHKFKGPVNEFANVIVKCKYRGIVNTGEPKRFLSNFNFTTPYSSYQIYIDPNEEVEEINYNEEE